MNSQRAVNNPFLGLIKADDLSFEMARTLFISSASSVWHAIRQRGHQVVVGAKGTGKTILMKQLHFENTLRADGARDVIGVYVQISRLSNLFRPLFSEAAADPPLPGDVRSRHQAAFADYFCAEIAREAADALRWYAEQTKTAIDDLVLAKAIDLDAPAVSEWANRLQRQIEGHLVEWQAERACDWKPQCNIATTPTRIFNGLLEAFSRHWGMTVLPILLLDESAPIPIACQEVVNSTLQRGRSFFTRLAVRPYEWRSFRTSLGTTLEDGNDFQSFNISYPDETKAEYQTLISAIADRVLEIAEDTELRGQAIRTVLGPTTLGESYAGFEAFCAVSSGNPQNFLSLCSQLCTVASDANLKDVTLPISADLQRQAMIAWAKDTEGTNAGPVKEVTKFFVRQIKKEQLHPTIGFSLAADGLFLDEDLRAAIEPLFSVGLLRPSQRTRYFDIPSSFNLTRAVLPAYDLDVWLPVRPPIAVQADEIRQALKERRGPGRALGIAPGSEIQAFLSTAFADIAARQRIDIKESLRAVGIRCQDIEDRPKGQLLFGSVTRLIEEAQITILNAAALRPYTLFECGLSAGANPPRPVIAVLDTTTKTDSVGDLPSFLRMLPIFAYQRSADGLSEMAAKVHAEATYLLSNSSEFKYVAMTNVSLRPRRDSATVYLSLPLFLANHIEVLRAELAELGLRVITESDAQIYAASELQVAIRCAYMAGAIFVDTSGKLGPDLLQCYKLGVATAARPKKVFRLEHDNFMAEASLSPTPVPYAHWSDTDTLTAAVLRLLGRRRDSIRGRK